MTGIRILVVDDDAITGLALNAVLSNMGYVVTAVATNGEDALKQVSVNPPDVVLTDISLGRGMNGIELAALIGKSCAVPVIFMSGHRDRNNVRRALSVGAAGYLVKPFSDVELRYGVEYALDARKDFFLPDDFSNPLMRLASPMIA